jgi:plastocyanin
MRDCWLQQRLLLICVTHRAAITICVTSTLAILAGGQSDPIEAAEPVAVIHMTNELKFQPARVTVRVGETVQWVNGPSTFAHTVTCDPAKAKQPEDVSLPVGAKAFDSGIMQSGATFQHMFTVAGTYKYFCIPHELLGMVGEVVVKPKEGKRDAGSEISPAEHPEQHSTGQENLGGGSASQTFLRWLGNFHPPAVQFPVALMVAAAAAELLFLVNGRPFFDIASRYCVWVSALGAVIAGPLGWCAGGFQFTDQSWVIAVHRWLGTSADVLAVATLALSELSRRRQSRALRFWFRVFLSVVAVLLLVTGFFGGAITYGLGHYSWPLGR